MKIIGSRVLLLLLICLNVVFANAFAGISTPRLHVEGRYLKDPHGNTVNLHGFAQTYSPWFNEMGTKWTNYNVTECLKYNKSKIDGIMAAGWKMNFLRLHMDPYWSNTPGVSTTGENDISAFSETRFRTYLDQVFIPMAEYAISKGLYVVMRPPGVCPENIAVGDAYNQYLLNIWDIVTRNEKLKNNPAIMFELANEPVKILGPNGDYGSNSQGHFDNLKKFLQPVVDKIRANGATNVLWIPGLGWQAKYKGFSVNPIEGNNIGYAIHVYPGWFGSIDGGNTSTINGYDGFKKAWDEEIKPVSDFAPVMVTEMDWADEKYKSSWGKGHTGTAGGTGFGANFKKIMDETGNVSWLIFTDAHLLAQFKDVAPATGESYTFLNDPEACPWPAYHWYQDYSKINFPHPDYTFQSHSDNGDGTFTNPVIHGDFPDPDVIRVGDVYYMSTTTMHHFPGATILKSYDLVNWEYCSNPLEKIESTDCYNLEGCNRYSRGQWASSLKYHKGTFYLHFNTLDEGSYLLTATSPEGPWTKNKLVTSFYDAGLFFDDDDKIYIVYGINNLHIAQLDNNFNVVKDQAITLGSVQAGIVNTGTEGSHLYKKDGYYYIYATTGGYYATQVCYRSTSIFGTYDEKEVFNFERIHQGALIQTQTGEWWTILFADKGAYGRLPMLEPVTWVDNWPIVGVSGKGVTTNVKPNVGKSYPATYLPTNDCFRDFKFAPQWEWNHISDNSKWSLVKRAGFLRLYTANVTDSLHKAKNTITQRILGFPANQFQSYGTIKMHLNKMANGDVAGLAVFQDPYAFIGVKMDNGQKNIVWLNTGTKTQQTGVAVTDSVMYLRAIANYNTSKADFYFSTDNVTYTQVGSLDMKYNLSVFVGNRFCIFNYATSAVGGYVDVDWFSTEKDFSENTFFDDSFKGYSVETLTLTELKTDKTELNLLTGSTKSFVINAVFQDGHTEDVTLSANYTISNTNVLTIKNGQMIAKSNGQATVGVTYQGGMGETKALTINVNSTYFPFTSDLFNPSIHEKGTFDAATHTLVTGPYGFGGWNYSAGLDLSNYKYLVAKLGSATSSGASLRVFDESSYWTKPAMANFGSGTQVVIDLANAKKDGTETKINRSHIYIVGIWSNGNIPIEISDVYVTNNSDYSKPAVIEPVTVKTTDCSCIGSNDGAINIVLSLPYTYSIALSGDGYSKTDVVSNSCNFTGLAAGTYNVNVSSAEVVDPVYFTVVINQPQELAVQKMISANRVAQYNLSGGDNYFVSVNNKTVVTNSSLVEVPLQAGANSISIRVDKVCQGVYEETIYMDKNGQLLLTPESANGKIQLNPNPADDEVTITVPGNDEQVTVEIVSLRGNMQFKQLKDVQANRTLTMNVSALPAGIYMLKVYGVSINDTVKLIKK
jgi:beta-xylosidase